MEGAESLVSLSACWFEIEVGVYDIDNIDGCLDLGDDVSIR